MKHNGLKTIVLLFCTLALIFIFAACVDEGTGDKEHSSCATEQNSYESTVDSSWETKHFDEGEPTDAVPSETEFTWGVPSETESTEPELSETESTEREPSETGSAEAEPSETESIEPEPLETESIEPEPSETESTEPEPSETESTGIEPIDPPVIPDVPDGASMGLEYALLENGTYAVVGIGTCEDTELLLGASYCGAAVTQIGAGAFAGCEQLQRILLPEGVLSIGDGAFAHCTALTSILLPESIESVGRGALAHCTALEQITVSLKNRAYWVNGSCLIEIESKTVIASSVGVEIPDDGTISHIGDGAFAGHALQRRLRIPEGIRSIGAEAFFGCGGVERVTLPTTLLNIGASAFSDCTVLEYVSLPEGLLEIGASAFSGCVKLNEVLLPAELSVLGEAAFSGCASLAQIAIPQGLTRIEKETFGGCLALCHAVIPVTVTEIGNGAFDGCTALETVQYEGEAPQWENIQIEDANTTLTDAARVYKPYWPTKGLQYALFDGRDGFGYYEVTGITGTDVSEIVISEQVGGVRVRGIASGAFSGNKKIERVIIVASEWKRIGEKAFYGCTALEEINIPEGISQIGKSAFYGCTSLEAIVLPESVQRIGERAFCGCSALRHISIPPAVERIEWATFANCTALESVTFSDCLEEISSYVFSGCSALQRIEIPSKIQYIASYTFSGCTLLNEISSMESLEGIGEGAFYDCRSLKNFSIPDGTKRIASKAFQGCNAIDGITLPSTLEQIGEEAFLGCTSLTEIEFPTTLERIDKRAFFGCTSLSDIRISAIPTTVGKEAFWGSIPARRVILENEVSAEDLIRLGRIFYGASFVLADGSVYIPHFLAYEYDVSNTARFYTKSPIYLPFAADHILHGFTGGSPCTLTVNGTDFTLDADLDDTIMIQFYTQDGYEDALELPYHAPGVSAILEDSGALVYFSAKEYYEVNGDSAYRPVASEAEALEIATAFIKEHVSHLNPDVTLADYRMLATLRNADNEGEAYRGYDCYHFTFTLYFGDVETSDRIMVTVSAGGNIVYFSRGTDCSFVKGLTLNLEDAYAHAWEQAHYQASYLNEGYARNVALQGIRSFGERIAFRFRIELPHKDPDNGAQIDFGTVFFLVVNPEYLSHTEDATAEDGLNTESGDEVLDVPSAEAVQE